ncbi:MAG: hypothetical protein ABSC46_07600 [Candidatus Limnocylindrales bacterium]|jgi:hypothetical protein
MDLIALLLGVLILALAAWDLFETIVVPRPTPGRFRISSNPAWTSTIRLLCST